MRGTCLLPCLPARAAPTVGVSVPRYDRLGNGRVTLLAVIAFGSSFTGVGLLLLAIGAFFYFRTKRFLARAVSVDGTLQGYEARSGGEGGASYHPVVNYTTADGQHHTFTSNTAAGRKWQPGDPVPIRYDSERPHKARIATFWYTWFLAVFMSIMGIGFLIPGVIALVT